MKISTHVIFQLLAVVLQVLNFTSGVVPPHYQPYVMVVISVLQSALAAYNHYFTPNGTPIQLGPAGPATK